MREFLSFQFPAISKEEELTTLQKARAIAQYMREDTPHEHIPFSQQEKTMDLEKVLQACADDSDMHKWEPKKKQLKLILGNGARVKISHWGDSLVTIKTKDFVYDASDLRELAEELHNLAEKWEINND